MIDIEYWVDRWTVGLLANINTYITAINTSHNDTLLPAFISDMFSGFDVPLESMPYDTYYRLYSDPIVKVQSGTGNAVSLAYDIHFEVEIKDTGDGNLYRKGHRFLTMFVQLFNAIIVKDVSGSSFLKAETLPYIFENGSMAQVTRITWEISVPS